MNRRRLFKSLAAFVGVTVCAPLAKLSPGRESIAYTGHATTPNSQTGLPEIIKLLSAPGAQEELAKQGLKVDFVKLTQQFLDAADWPGEQIRIYRYSSGLRVVYPEDESA